MDDPPVPAPAAAVVVAAPVPSFFVLWTGGVCAPLASLPLPSPPPPDVVALSGPEEDVVADGANAGSAEVIVVATGGGTSFPAVVVVSVPAGLDGDGAATLAAQELGFTSDGCGCTCCC